MPRLSFQEVKRIEGIAVSTNALLAKYAHKLDGKAAQLPTKVEEAHSFRMRVENVSGALIDIAKFRAADLFSGNGDDEKTVLKKLDSDKEMAQILEAIVSLNGHQGLGHQTVKDIARLTSNKPSVVASVKARLEKKIDQLVEKCRSEGRIAMDIVRHVAAPPQPQCLFVVAR